MKNLLYKDKRISLLAYQKHIISEQAPYHWYQKFDAFIHKINFHKLNPGHCCYVKDTRNNDCIIIFLYVDDMFIIETNIKKINYFKRQVS